MTQLGNIPFLADNPSSDAGNIHSRRSFLVASAAAGTFGLLSFSSSSYAEPSGIGASSTPPPSTPGDTAIRPFRINIPEAELADLRRRIDATRWPERETVTDATQGVQLATMQKLAQLLGDGLRLAQVRGEAERPAAISSPRSTGSTFISSTFARSMRMRCRSSSRTAGPARSSSS